MLRNYLRIAWRTLRKHKVSTAINVGGLAVGMACCLWLLMFVQYEWSFDRFHDDADRLVRITQETVQADGSISHTSLLAPPLGTTLEATLPEVEKAVRIQKSSVTLHDERFSEEVDILFVDPAFFEIFSFPLLAGDPASALSQPDRIVISESEAQRLFGTVEATGETLTIEFENETRDIMVSGVAEDPPATSSIPFSFVMPMENVDLQLPEPMAQAILDSWTFGIMHTFARLAPNADPPSLEAGLERLVADRLEDPETKTLHAQPITEIRHATHIQSGLSPTSDPRYAYILGAIALFILVIAAINFVTLSLGRSAARAQEVGVRKSIGATRAQLGIQFWCEAILVCGIALVGGLVIAQLLLPVFNNLTGVPLELGLVEHPVLWMGFLGLILGVGLLAGGYPAWVLARMKASSILRGQQSAKARGGFSRVLIVVQFALSVGLVACTFIMSEQLRYMSEADLGFTDAPIVTMQPEFGVLSQEQMSFFQSFKQEAERFPAIHSVTGSWVTFGSRGSRVELETREGEVMSAYYNQIEPNFPETMELQLVEGHGPAAEVGPSGLLVNERLVRELGLSDPVGETLSVHDPNPMTERLGEAPILGVVRDYHVTSLDEEIPPLILVPHEYTLFGVRTYTARLHTGRTEEGLTALASAWEQVFPEQPFEYTFLQDQIAGQYESERRWRTLVGYAAILALLIACFGVFGQAALEASRRTKEIGIRKVLGATATSIVGLLSKDLVRLVVLGALIAAPLAYYAMQRWLEGYAYRIEPGPELFVAATIAALAIALLTASYHGLKAALTDPAKSLRYE